MSSAFRAEQLDSHVDGGFAGQGQQLEYQPELFAGGNADYFAAKQSGTGSDLHAMQFVDSGNDDPKSKKEVEQKPGTEIAAKEVSVQPLQPMVSWKIDVKDTPAGGKHMGIKGLGEGDLAKQADGSFKGELVDANGEKTPVEINPDGTVKVEVDGNDYKFKLKPDGTVDSVTSFGWDFERTDRSDGTGEVKHNDGTPFKVGTPDYKFKINADGSEERQYADGSTEHATEAGSLRKYPNGSTREVMADGTTVYKDAVNGIVVRATPDHITTITYPDGTKITKLPNNTTVTRDPDGTTRTQSWFEGSSTKLPDGTVIRTTPRPNGDVHVDVIPPGQKPAGLQKPAGQHKPATPHKPAASHDAAPQPAGKQGRIPAEGPQPADGPAPKPEAPGGKPERSAQKPPSGDGAQLYDYADRLPPTTPAKQKRN